MKGECGDQNIQRMKNTYSFLYVFQLIDSNSARSVLRDSTIPSFVFKERQLLLLPVPRISILFKSERVCTLGDVNFSCTSRDTQKYFESYLPCMSHDSINFIVGREIAKCAFRHYINRTQSYVVRDDSFNRMFVSTDWSESNLKAQAKILNVNLR